MLDPAVGSGAFPMGVLHKLTLALRRLDPGNDLWADLQRKQARRRAGETFDTEDQADRNTELEDISATFERYRDSDFGRKLYIIQNGIYGVDIQPIATQIAKLRFFISLAIDQEPTDDAGDNYGIKPLPNLETRFVAADSLLGLDRPAQMALGQTGPVKELQTELDRNRERHFHAQTREQKLGFRDEDKRLRQGLAEALQEADFSAGDAEKISTWDPYDQNASSPWFDPGYMFGVSDGFDVVITNPPYIHIRRLDLGQRQTYGRAGFTTFSRMGDIYQLFLEKGSQLTKSSSGVLSYITSNSWMKGEYGKSTRLSWFRINVRLSVQRKCHSVRPRWYQMMTPWDPPGIVALEDPRQPGISWWRSGGFPIPARLLEAISHCAGLAESPATAPAGGRSACARRWLWAGRRWPHRQ